MPSDDLTPFIDQLGLLEILIKLVLKWEKLLFSSVGFDRNLIDDSGG